MRYLGVVLYNSHEVELEIKVNTNTDIKVMMDSYSESFPSLRRAKRITK